MEMVQGQQWSDRLTDRQTPSQTIEVTDNPLTVLRSPNRSPAVLV